MPPAGARREYIPVALTRAILARTAPAGGIGTRPSARFGVLLRSMRAAGTIEMPRRSRAVLLRLNEAKPARAEGSAALTGFCSAVVERSARGTC